MNLAKKKIVKMKCLACGERIKACDHCKKPFKVEDFVHCSKGDVEHLCVTAFPTKKPT